MSVSLPYAAQVADRIFKILGPHCDRIHIAGSIRRQVSIVSDIEIIAQPKKEIKNKDLFGTGEQIVSKDFVEALASITSMIIKGNVAGRYMQIVLVKCEITMDMFLPAAADYYRILAIRTGSSEYAHKVIATAWKRKGWCGSDHGFRRLEDCVETIQGDQKKYKCIRLDGQLPPAWESEQEFFQWLGIKYIDAPFRDLKQTLNEAL